MGGDVQNNGSDCGFRLDPEDPDTWPNGVVIDPESVDQSDLPTCQRDALDDHETCGLHLSPSERPEDFNATKAVADELTASLDPGQMTTGLGGTASFVGIHLESLDFGTVSDQLESDVKLSQLTEIDLRFARVEGTLTFSGPTIPCRVQLRGVAIGRLVAPNTTFEQDVTLTNSSIGGLERTEHRSDSEVVVDLSSGAVEGDLSLQEARISGNVSLSGMAPISQLIAHSAEIDGLLALDGTEIQEQTRLRGATCTELSAIGADFHRAALSNVTVKGMAQLDNLNLWGMASDDTIKLGTATFEDDVSLRRATFHTAANLRSLTVNGRLELENADFQGKADLRDAEIDGPIEATDITFSAPLDASAARFEDRVRFNQARFADSVQFEKAVFADHAYFDQANFHGIAIYDEAEFHADCFFRAVVTGRTASDGGSDPGSAEELPPVGVFHDSASFKRTFVQGQADFRIVEPEPEANEPFSPGAELAQTANTVAGEFLAPEATLSGAMLAGLTASKGLDFRGTNLSNSNLRQADLREAKAEHAIFSHANCFGTKFQKARLHGAVFNGTRIDDRTEFGARVIYHEEVEQISDPVTKRSKLEKAISLYSQLETLARDSGQPVVVRTMFVERKNAQRSKIPYDNQPRTIRGREFPADSVPAAGIDYVRRILAFLKWLIMRYGESYVRVIASSVAVIVVFGVVFPLLNLEHETTDQLGYQWDLGSIIEAVRLGILYSLSAFTTFSIDGFTSGYVAQAIALVEAGVGILMFGLLLFVLQRRTAR